MFWPLSWSRPHLDVVHFGVDWGDGERPVGWEGFRTPVAVLATHEVSHGSDSPMTASVSAIGAAVARVPAGRVYSAGIGWSVSGWMQ